MSKLNIEINFSDIVSLLEKLKVAEKELSVQSQLIYTLMGSCDGEYTKSVDSITEVLYRTLELLGFNSEMLYDWMHDSEEFLLFSDGFIYNVIEPIDFAKYTLTTMKLKDFNPVGEYVEKDGKLIKTMYNEGE